MFYVAGACVEARGGQERVSVLLELEVQMLASQTKVSRAGHGTQRQSTWPWMSKALD